MILEILPTRTAGAAENMAVDFLLLQRYPRAAVPRFRHYEWRAPAFTFGYAQKIAFVRTQLPPDATFDLCRRQTGGGLVDHRDDWTYALVIPRGHPLEEVSATQSYRLIHEALADALRAQQIDAITQTSVIEPGSERDGTVSAGQVPSASAMPTPGVCFQRAELHDVVLASSGAKIAGAAQKRNKHGLLFQGSIARSAMGGVTVDWDQFAEDFVGRLSVALECQPETVRWPELNDDEVSGLAEQYASTEWIEYR